MILFWLRFGRFYAASETLGPTLVMIRMILVSAALSHSLCLQRAFADLLQNNVFVFVALWMLLMIGYAIALYSLTNPDRYWDTLTVSDIFFRFVIDALSQPR